MRKSDEACIAQKRGGLHAVEVLKSASCESVEACIVQKKR